MSTGLTIEGPDSAPKRFNYANLLKASGNDSERIVEVYGGWENGGLRCPDWDYVFAVLRDTLPTVLAQLPELVKKLEAKNA